MASPDSLTDRDQLARLNAEISSLRQLVELLVRAQQQQRNATVPQLELLKPSADGYQQAQTSASCIDTGQIHADRQQPAVQCQGPMPVTESAQSAACEPQNAAHITQTSNSQLHPKLDEANHERQQHGTEHDLQQQPAKRPKPLVHLDFPHEEQRQAQQLVAQASSVAVARPALASLGPPSVPVAVQQQHVSLVPAPAVPAKALMFPSGLYKPSIADVVLHYRAATHAQQRASENPRTPRIAEGAGSSSITSASHLTPAEAPTAAACTAGTTACEGRGNGDNSVHIDYKQQQQQQPHQQQSSSCSLDQKQQQQSENKPPLPQQQQQQQQKEQWQQQPQPQQAGAGCNSWSIGACYDINMPAGALAATAAGGCQGCNAIDLLARRVHLDACSAASSYQQEEQALITDHNKCSRLLARCLWRGVKGLKAIFWDVLLPTGSAMVAWDLMMLLLITYLCVVLPYAVAFNLDFCDLSNPIALLDFVINIIFMVDVWMNFRTAYVGDDGRLVTDRRSIAVRYLKGWFLFDFLSSIPYEQLLSISSLPSLFSLLKIARMMRIMKVLRLLKLLRMARVVRLPQVMARLEAVVGRVLLQLLTLGGSMVLLLHWGACVWYYVAWLGEDGDNWVVHNQLLEAGHLEQYITALYWSVTTIATVGYGDIVGHTIREKIVAMVAMLIGASVFGYFMGAMSVMVSALNSAHARMATKRQAVDDFLKHRKVPRVLADKVRSYYNYVVEREVQADEADIISGLSASLRTQVVLHLYQEALEKVPFFKGQHPHFITSVVTFLKLEYYAPGDIVVRQGDVGAEMYFVGEGMLEVRLYEDEHGSPLSKAMYKRSATKYVEQHRGAVSAVGSRPATACSQSRMSPTPPGQAVLETAASGAGSNCACPQGPHALEHNSSSSSSSSNLMWLLSACKNVIISTTRAVSGMCGGRLWQSGTSYNSNACSPSKQQPPDSSSSSNLKPHGPRSGNSGRCKGSAHCVPEEFSLPVHGNKKLQSNWTYSDELGDMPFRRIGYLRPGEYFGELSCLLGEARTETVVATSYCELYSLSRMDLEEVLQQWPELAEEFEAMVQSAADHRAATPSLVGTASGPLTKWNVVKAAYQHNVASKFAAPVNPLSQEQLFMATTPTSDNITRNQAAARVDLMPRVAVPAGDEELSGTTSAAEQQHEEHRLHQQSSPRPSSIARLSRALQGLQRSNSNTYAGLGRTSITHKAHTTCGSLAQLCEARPSLGRRLSVELSRPNLPVAAVSVADDAVMPAAVSCWGDLQPHAARASLADFGDMQQSVQCDVAAASRATTVMQHDVPVGEWDRHGCAGRGAACDDGRCALRLGTHIQAAAGGAAGSGQEQQLWSQSITSSNIPHATCGAYNKGNKNNNTSSCSAWKPSSNTSAFTTTIATTVENQTPSDGNEMGLFAALPEYNHAATLALSRNNSLSRGSANLCRHSAPLSRSHASLSRSSPTDMRRPLSWVPGQGTGLFQASNGGYLFPAIVDRSGVLIQQEGHCSNAIATSAIADVLADPNA